MKKKKQQGLLSQRLQNQHPQSSNKNNDSSFVIPNPEIVIDYDEPVKTASANKPNTKKPKKNPKKHDRASEPTPAAPISAKDRLKQLSGTSTSNIPKNTFGQSQSFTQGTQYEAENSLDLDKIANDIKIEKNKKRYKEENTAEIIKEKTPAKIILKKIFTRKHILIGVLTCFLLFVAIEQIPSLIYNVLPESAKSSNHIVLTVEENSANTTKSILQAYPQEDFDNDKIVNGEDKDPYNPDSDLNGIIDGDISSSPIKSQTKVSNEKAEITVSNNLSGIKKFDNYYVFTDYKGWAKFDDTQGFPYIYRNCKWKEAEYQHKGNYIYVYIPGDDCRIEFLKDKPVPVSVIRLFGGTFAYANGKSASVKNVGFAKYIFDAFFSVLLPQENGSGWGIGSIQQTTDYHYALYRKDTTAPAVIGTYDLTTPDRYMSYNNSLSELENIYAMIDEDHTVLCSFQSDKGECLGIVYGYDYLGNLYIADYRTGELVGMLNIIPKSQIITSGDERMIRDWYEFNGLGFSSAEGDRAVFIFPE